MFQLLSKGLCKNKEKGMPLLEKNLWAVQKQMSLMLIKVAFAFLSYEANAQDVKALTFAIHSNV
jgi:hypothetical protein